MRASTLPTPSAWLVAVAGPSIEPIEISEKPEGITLGRHEQCQVRLPLSAEQVSRFHARFTREGTATRVADLGSRWGTFVNGMRLEANHETPLAEGDLIRITPWTFTLSSTPSRRGLQTSEDSTNTLVRSVSPEQTQPLAQDMLALLLESAAAIHASGSEKELAERVIDAAVRGTGLMNVAMLKPVDNQGRYEVISSRLGPAAERGGPSSFSRSLLQAAASGNVAEISGGMGGNISESIVMMKINAAVCVPLMLGGVPAAFLYLDSRGTMPQSLRPNASSFCVALGRMASLALANIKRQEMEKREAQMQAELNAAAQAQRWILPKRQQTHPPLIIVGESKPGQQVGGDFFDVIPLEGGRLAITLGDVSGKGIAASVLMTAAQGFLHAALAEGRDLTSSINALNRFIHPRRPASKFLTMWACIIDPAAGQLSYIDAGHSYAVLRRATGEMLNLDAGGGLPIGIDESETYTAGSAPFTKGDSLVVVSDGIIEQFGQSVNAVGEREQFGVEGLKRCMQSTVPDLVACLFDAVVEHAGTTKLADDATIVWVTH